MYFEFIFIYINILLHIKLLLLLLLLLAKTVYKILLYKSKVLASTKKYLFWINWSAKIKISVIFRT